MSVKIASKCKLLDEQSIKETIVYQKCFLFSHESFSANKDIPFVFSACLNCYAQINTNGTSSKIDGRLSARKSSRKKK